MNDYEMAHPAWVLDNWAPGTLKKRYFSKLKTLMAGFLNFLSKCRRICEYNMKNAQVHMAKIAYIQWSINDYKIDGPTWELDNWAPGTLKETLFLKSKDFDGGLFEFFEPMSKDF